MATKKSIDSALEKLTKLCLAFPEASAEARSDYAAFRVRKKVFAYYLNNHHGDGIVSVAVKSELGENVDRASCELDTYYLPAYIGSRGWFAMRLDKGPPDWFEVKNIFERSYALVAPKTLLSKHKSAGGA